MPRHVFSNSVILTSVTNVDSGEPVQPLLVGLTSPMLHTKSQGYMPSVSGEDFKGVLPYT